MLNVEVTGIVGSVSIGADKKTNLPVLKVVLMDDQGKSIKTSSKKIDDRVSMLKSRDYVTLRYEGLDFLMSEFGNLTFRAETVVILKEEKELKKAA